MSIPSPDLLSISIISTFGFSFLASLIALSTLKSKYGKSSVFVITDGENSVKGYQFIENSKDLLVEFSLNQYEDVKFNSYEKPIRIMKYEFETEKLSGIIPQEIQRELQKLVEGKK